MNAVFQLLSQCIGQKSGISIAEYVYLLASTEALFDDEVNCRACKYQYGKKNEHKTIGKRTAKGCFELGKKPYKIENIKYGKCPGNMALPLDYLFDSFILYEKGIMPFQGTLGEQPNKVIEIFNIIKSRKNYHTKRLEKQGR